MGDRSGPATRWRANRLLSSREATGVLAPEKRKAHPRAPGMGFSLVRRLRVSGYEAFVPPCAASSPSLYMNLMECLKISRLGLP